jgi:hypothetical protein
MDGQKGRGKGLQPFRRIEILSTHTDADLRLEEAVACRHAGIVPARSTRALHTVNEHTHTPIIHRVSKLCSAPHPTKLESLTF